MEMKEDFKNTVFYIIEFSKSRNKFRLETSGSDPKKHQFYSTALKKLSELQIEQYELKFLNEINE